MITPENITRKQAKELVKLLSEETRCEIMARYGEWGRTLGYIDYALKQIEARKKIHKLLYGSSDLVELGIEWKMLKARKKKKKK